MQPHHLSSPVAILAVAAVLLTACAAALPSPALVPHPRVAYELVQYPPPPARVEVIPPKPRDSAVWLDGEWIWDGTRWGWQLGRWVDPPRGAKFAKWCTVRQSDGSLFAARGAWFDASGREVAAPPALATARARSGSIVNSDGDLERTRPNVAPGR